MDAVLQAVSPVWALMATSTVLACTLGALAAMSVYSTGSWAFLSVVYWFRYDIREHANGTGMMAGRARARKRSTKNTKAQGGIHIFRTLDRRGPRRTPRHRAAFIIVAR